MAGRRPNILIFMTDHQRYDMAPPYGACLTPNLDALARESVLFTNMRCPAPHCCPSRATFFSGLYPSAHGVWNNVNVGNTLSHGLARGVRLWSEDMAQSGYRLFFSGKWHVSGEEGPQQRGFECVYHTSSYTGIRPADLDRVPDCHEWQTEYRPEVLCDMAAPRPIAGIKRPGYPRYCLYGESENPFGDREVIAASVEHIARRLPDVSDPWLFYVGNLGPHDPYFVPKRFLDMYDPDSIKLPASWSDSMRDKPALYRRTRALFDQLSAGEQREALRHYLAFCTYEDYLFGQLVDALKVAGLYEDTMIVYCSDHGDYAGAHGLWAKGLPCFKEAYRVPFIVRVPGRTCALEVADRCSLADFAPTVLELAGIGCARRFAGRSLVPYLRSGQAPNPPRYSFTQTNGNEVYGIQRSIESDDWKYVFNAFDFDELYDLRNDPNELCNLAGDPRYQHVVRDLCAELWRFARDNSDTYINPYIMTAFMPFGPGILSQEQG